jgi:hypothetical protein
MTSNTNFKSKKNPEDIPDFFPQKQPKSGIQIYITPTCLVYFKTAIYKYRYTFGDSVVKIGTLYHKNR